MESAVCGVRGTSRHAEFKGVPMIFVQYSPRFASFPEF
jgi:hypothetical protein